MSNGFEYPTFVRYGDYLALVTKTYSDSNGIDTLYDLFVFAPTPHIQNGVSGKNIWGEEVPPSSTENE